MPVSLAHNPVYLRLMRRRRWSPSRRVVSFGIAAAILLALPLIPALIVDPKLVVWLGVVPAVMAVIFLVLLLFSPPFVLMITTLTIAREVRREDFRLLGLSNVSPADVVAGYLEAALARLGPLWNTGLGILPGAGLAFVYYCAALAVEQCTPARGCLVSLLIVGVLGAFAAGALALLMGVALCGFAVIAGNWLALRFRDSAIAAAGGMLAVYFALLVLSGWMIVPATTRGVSMFLAPAALTEYWPVLCALPLIGYFAFSILTPRLIGGAVHAVEARSRAGEPRR